MFYQALGKISINTYGQSLVEITNDIDSWIKKNNCIKGILNIYIMHTSASLIIQENADPDVLEDLLNFFSKNIPYSNKYLHKSEGNDDMPAHIKSAITHTCLSLSIQEGFFDLGTWQGIYLFEHREKPQKRKISLHFIGEKNID